MLANFASNQNNPDNPNSASVSDGLTNSNLGGDDRNSNNKEGGNGGTEAKRNPPFSMPGVLHFLQHEWSRYELERAQWEMERSELKARISFLIGERKAQENLKHDLVRRIKMLEYALKQERIKFQHDLAAAKQNKEGESQGNNGEREEEEMGLSHAKSNVPLDIDAVLPPPPKLTDTTKGDAAISNQTWAQARETLRQYLQEIGYTEKILDVRSFRVKQLLGILPNAGEKGGGKGASESRRFDAADKALLESEQAILEAAEAIKTTRKVVGGNNQHKRKQDEEDSDSSDEHAGDDGGLDTEAVEAFSEFSFLKSEKGRAPKVKNGGGAVKESLDEMKERFKSEQERRRQQSIQGKQHSIGGAEHSSPPAAYPSVQQSPNKRNISVDTVHGIPPTTVQMSSSSEMFIDDEKFADIKSGFEDDDTDLQQLRWNIRYTLRSHYDSIRAMQFHPVEPVLITASEDGTAKLWDLNHSSVASAKGGGDGSGKSSQLPQPTTGIVDIEPVYTFRGHSGPILTMDFSSMGETCYTGGVDGVICCWNVPSTTSALDIYQPFDPSVLQERLTGHTEPIWSLCFHSASNRIVSAAADGTIRIWIVGLADGAMPSPLLKTITLEDGQRPRSIDLISTAEHQLLVASSGPHCNIRDLETGQVVLNFQMRENGDDKPDEVNKILSHPTMPVSITAGEDRKIRFFDNNSGKLISATIAHVEGVSALAIDPNGLYMLSGSHDGSLRLWNAERRICIQEIAAHRKKLGSGVMTVAFHPSRQLIGSAGADSLAKVYGQVRTSPRGSLTAATASPPSSSSGSSGPSSLVGSPQKSSSSLMGAKQIASSQL